VKLQKYIFLLFIVIALGKTNCFAQAKLFDSLLAQLDSIPNLDEFLDNEKKTTISFQSKYINNYVWLGRADSAGLPYLTNSIDFTHKSGIFASVLAAYTTNAKAAIDYYSFDIGYNFNVTKKLDATVAISKPWYVTGSRNATSDVNWSLGVSANYKNKIANISAGLYSMFSSKTDNSLTLGLDHSFVIDDSSYQINITPTFMAFWGSQSYYNSKKTRNPNRNAQVTTTQKFELLSLEFSLPLTFDKQNWGISFTPTFAIPKNPYTETLVTLKPNGQPIGPVITSYESLQNQFFWELGFYIKFDVFN
jgi:hypothetical protein